MAEKSASIDKTVAELFPEGEYKDPTFVPAKGLPFVSIHTDNPERVILDGVYVVKSKDHGDVQLVLAGTFNGKLPKTQEVYDGSEAPYLRIKRAAEARIKAAQEKEAAAKK